MSNSPLNKLVNALTVPPQVAGQKRKRTSGTTRRRVRARTARGLSARNPGSRNPIRRADNMLALTRDQFTATSPLNLFQVGPGSTPGGIRVRGRELVGATIAPAALTGVFSLLNIAGTNSLAINPITFPRLSAYVPIYEYFKFHKCAFLFQSNQPTTAVGEVLLAVDYDVKDQAPTSAIGMMRNISSTMANIYSDASLEMLSSLSRLPKYVTSEFASVDTAQVQQGALYIAAEGVTSASGATLGYVICQYDIEFFTPQ